MVIEFVKKTVVSDIASNTEDIADILTLILWARRIARYLYQYLRSVLT